MTAAVYRLCPLCHCYRLLTRTDMKAADLCAECETLRIKAAIDHVTHRTHPFTASCDACSDASDVADEMKKKQ